MNPENLARARADVARLSAEEVRQLLRGAQVPDERSFIEATSITDKENGGLVPFRLWESQAALLPLLSCPRLYVLKARQLGLTTLSLVHWLYETTFWGNRLILIARQSREDALDALRRIKLLRASLGCRAPRLAAAHRKGQPERARLCQRLTLPRRFGDQEDGSRRGRLRRDPGRVCLLGLAGRAVRGHGGSLRQPPPDHHRCRTGRLRRGPVAGRRSAGQPLEKSLSALVCRPEPHAGVVCPARSRQRPSPALPAASTPPPRRRPSPRPRASSSSASQVRSTWSR